MRFSWALFLFEKIRKFRTLSGQEQRLWLLAGLLLPGLWALTRVLPFDRLLRWLDRAPRMGKPAVSIEEVVAAGAVVNSAAFHILGPENCLVRSLFLQWLLRRKGVESELRIGGRLEAGGFKAHAWVEVEGRPVNDSPDVGERFAAFDQPITHDLVATP